MSLSAKSALRNWRIVILAKHVIIHGELEFWLN